MQHFDYSLNQQVTRQKTIKFMNISKLDFILHSKKIKNLLEILSSLNRILNEGKFWDSQQDVGRRKSPS